MIIGVFSRRPGNQVARAAVWTWIRVVPSPSAKSAAKPWPWYGTTTAGTRAL